MNKRGMQDYLTDKGGTFLWKWQPALKAKPAHEDWTLTQLRDSAELRLLITSLRLLPFLWKNQMLISNWFVYIKEKHLQKFGGN